MAEAADNNAPNQEILKLISEMRLFDDSLMTLVFDKNIPATEKLFGDGSHILYVNGSYKDDKDPVGRLGYECS